MDSVYDEYYIAIVDILNKFNHLPSFHNTDNEFAIIYTLFGGFCEVENCNEVQRQCRNRQQIKG